MFQMNAIKIKNQQVSILDHLLIVFLASVCLSLCGRFALPLPFTPIPLAIQSVFVLGLSSLLGWQKSAMAVGLFLIQGACGLPVFAGGLGGLAVLLGPKGGYLVGYWIAAVVVGYLSERLNTQNIGHLFLMMGLGSLTILFSGACYLSLFLGWKQAFLLGVCPFVVGDLLKCIVAVKCVAWVRQKQASFLAF